ncbi:hypothetical protein [Amaricoccus solimangrovi]|uniref:Uncharacterized protein n=1 Tax=Amaricoccus solimangrovi TaxID=2589815 RepID=A0A501WRD3_9RHOB|nr:hypothetical protein [Amaricoccus solimangrovi]TPE49561.1 hypothetical protein FJM51_14365 [Amaricoccus solimangrovi]
MRILRRPSQLLLSAAEAHEIIVWLYGSTQVPVSQITADDRGFAQAMLQDMLERSFEIGFVEALFRSLAKLPQGPRKIISSFLIGAGKNLVKYGKRDDLETMIREPRIYQMVKDDTVRHTRSAWNVREQTGELTY